MVAQKVFTRGKARCELGPRILIYVECHGRFRENLSTCVRRPADILLLYVRLPYKQQRNGHSAGIPGGLGYI